MSRLESQKALESLRKKLQMQRDPKRPVISLCAGSGCGAYGTDEVKDALDKEISQNGARWK
jgi:NADH-quinone oxidoreductase subunit F